MLKPLTLSLFTLAIVSPTVYAIEPGLGVSFKSNDINIYLPVNVSKSFRVEPFIGQYKSNEKEQSDKVTYSEKEFGIGAFGLHKKSDNIGLYYGARVAYLENRYAYSSSYDGGYSSNNKSSDEQSGYSFAPVLGFEYSVIPQLTVGGEASWEFVELDGKDRGSFDNTYSVSERSAKTETSQNTTVTRLMVRYYF